ncbi:hypothetical protein [Ottowia sp.]|uniref:hypothetical protein n=1 Tax=Ottowia sp. TaxID=1898956 RepID=UPI002C0B8D5F|nr:hypothetical protein [Ottowia sp.]HPZ58000.1 hypothetical protein [Ottowia sp.]HQD46452.1 hypothetical protein [Ottowia sp.]
MVSFIVTGLGAGDTLNASLFVSIADAAHFLVLDDNKTQQTCELVHAPHIHGLHGWKK